MEVEREIKEGEGRVTGEMVGKENKSSKSAHQRKFWQKTLSGGDFRKNCKLKVVIILFFKKSDSFKSWNFLRW